MDSALPKRSKESNSAPQDVIYLEPVQTPISEDRNLKSRKFIVSMTLITVSSIFTALGMMDINTWIVFTGGVGATYLGVNIYQKTM